MWFHPYARGFSSWKGESGVRIGTEGSERNKGQGGYPSVLWPVLSSYRDRGSETEAKELPEELPVTLGPSNNTLGLRGKSATSLIP